MKVIVPHHKTQQEAIQEVDARVTDLFSGMAGGAVQVLNFKKTWDGPEMTFSFTGSFGFISIPVTGTVAADDTDIVIECELPALVRSLAGEDKISKNIEARMKKMLAK